MNRVRMGEALAFRVVEARAWLRDCMTRLPFRFGVVTMRGAPLCVLRVVVEFADGGRGEGYASDLLVPKWFEKVAGQSVGEDWKRLTEGIVGACADVVADGLNARAFEHWLALDDKRVMGFGGERSTRLLLGQGVSLVERAMIDAVCRRVGGPFHEAMLGGATGFDGSRLGVEEELSSVVRRRPLGRMWVRHTVGLVDAIEEGDVVDRPGDGLPASLAGAIAAQGLTHFKLKVSGDIGGDLERLGRIARVVRAACGDAALCTLDGNEQFESVAALGALLARMDEEEDTRWLRGRVAYVEQPVSRGRTFEAATAGGLAGLGVPVIIDEADVDREALAEAAGLGYRGVSVKNCKGVFRAVASAMRCYESGGRLFQSAEDLTNIPVVALQQDLVTGSSLGLSHVERNGHQYFAGLGHLSEAERGAVLEVHGDLYEAVGVGRLAIRDGAISIGSLHEAAGYGYAGRPDLSGWTPIEEWSAGGLLAEIEKAGGQA